MNNSFKMFGGIQYSSNKNIVKSNIENSQNKTISNKVGLLNSKVASEGSLDISGNYILNLQCLYFISTNFKVNRHS